MITVKMNYLNTLHVAMYKYSSVPTLVYVDIYLDRLYFDY